MEKNTKQFNNEKNNITYWQALRIRFNRIFFTWKFIIALLGIMIIPIFNKILIQIKPINDFNNGYMKLLNIFKLDNIIILKHISANLILSIITYILFLIAISNSSSLDKKTNKIKELKITDNKEKNGNTIIPIRNTLSLKNRHLKSMVCYSNGILPKDFEENDNLERLSKKWNRYIIGVEEYKLDKLKIYYSNRKNKKVIFWEKDMLSNKDFELVLGENDYKEKLTINIDECPHIIISSSSGGGKTTEFKLLILQSILKGAQVVIIDMKGGLDFNKGWKDLDSDICEVYSDIDLIYNYMHYYILDEVRRRTELLNEYQCSNISEFNRKVNNKEIKSDEMRRIIIGIDEASQIFSKSKNKENEDTLQKIRESFEVVAEVYRSVGVHLFISTQVPSSNILTEKIRHNASYRICGRANKILSNIVVESDLASQIKNNERGRFVDNEGKFFQGYLFYEKDYLPKLKKKEQ